MEYLAACPICKATHFTSYNACVDHTVSKEVFKLEKCLGCGFVFTNPRPAENELSRYYQSEAYISHTNKATGFVNTAYKLARKFTLRWKYDLIQTHARVKPSSILDYGCGTGAFLSECQKNGLAIAGVEPSDTARNQAHTLTGKPIAAELAEVDGSFDVITLWHVLEHVYHLNQTVEALATRLNINGTIFLAVPNLESADAKKYQANWAAFDVPRHLWHFSRDTMGKLLANHDLKVAGILPMLLDAFYVSLLSEKYANNHAGVAGTARAIIQGWRSNQEAKKTAEYSSLIYIVRK